MCFIPILVGYVIMLSYTILRLIKYLSDECEKVSLKLFLLKPYNLHLLKAIYEGRKRTQRKEILNERKKKFKRNTTRIYLNKKRNF